MSELDEESNNLETSQLDVISCGLGAAALLAIVFSIVKDIPPVELSAPKFAKVVFACDRSTSEFDIVVKPPDGPTKTIIVSDYFQPNGSASGATPFPLSDFGSFRVRSISPIDQLLMEAIAEDPDAAHRVVYSIEIDSPAVGKWTFDLLYRSQATQRWNELGANAPNVAVTVITQTRQQQPTVRAPRSSAGIGDKLNSVVTLTVQ